MRRKESEQRDDDQTLKVRTHARTDNSTTGKCLGNTLTSITHVAAVRGSAFLSHRSVVFGTSRSVVPMVPSFDIYYEFCWKFGMCLQIVFVYAIFGFRAV